MNRRRLLPAAIVVLLFAVCLVAAQCSAPPAAPVAEATQPPAADTDEDAEPTVTVAPATSEAGVDESQAALARAPEGGISVTGDEDVTTPRTHLGGEYRDVSTSDAVSFHPFLTSDTASSSYQAMVWTGGLLRLDEHTLDYIPNMAEKYTISEDGLTFTFTLRKNMLWSDGQPITARDFEWTYRQASNPDNGFPYLLQMQFITSYKALDDTTLEIKIAEVYAPALSQMVGMIIPLPKHVWENLDWRDPEKNPEITAPSVVSGPYKLVDWKRDQYVRFEANDKYWYKGSPNIRTYTIEIVPDQDIAYEKMKTGQADTSPITPVKLDEARHLENVTVYEWWPAAALWSYIGLNNRAGFATGDINVRHGLSYALQKGEGGLLEVMEGQAQRLCSIYPPTSWAYDANVPCYDYNPGKALEAFEAAGYTQKDGVMVNDAGQPLKLRLIYGPNTSQTLELIAVSVQDQLAQMGIEVQIDAMEWATFLEATDAAEPKWDMYLGAWRATIEPHIMYTIWAEENIPQLNSVAYVNKSVEMLFDQAGATYDTTLRKEKYAQIQKIIAEDSPYIFLFYQKAWSGQNKRIQGIVPTALGIGYNMEDWYIREGAPE